MARDTRARAAAARLAVRELECRRDVDTVEDLRAAWPVVRALIADRPGLREAIEAALEASRPA